MTSTKRTTQAAIQARNATRTPAMVPVVPAPATPAPATPTPTPAKTPKAPKRRVPQQPCRCGCGSIVHRFFAQGHDARMKGWIVRANSAVAPFPPTADATFARDIGVGGVRLAPLPVAETREQHVARLVKAAEPKTKTTKATKATVVVA